MKELICPHCKKILSATYSVFDKNNNLLCNNCKKCCFPVTEEAEVAFRKEVIFIPTSGYNKKEPLPIRRLAESTISNDNNDVEECLNYFA